MALESCKERGVPVVFVEIPLPPQLAKLMPAGIEEGFLRTIGDFSTRYRVPFVPLTELGVSFVARDFADASHLNLRGANKFTKAAARKVLQLGLLSGQGSARR
jgi:hypothetical protein